MNFNIDIQINNKTTTFTGHWLTECENWEAAMKRAILYAQVFMHNEGCSNIDYIKVDECFDYKKAFEMAVCDEK